MKCALLSTFCWFFDSSWSSITRVSVTRAEVSTTKCTYLDMEMCCSPVLLLSFLYNRFRCAEVEHTLGLGIEIQFHKLKSILSRTSTLASNHPLCLRNHSTQVKALIIWFKITIQWRIREFVVLERYQPNVVRAGLKVCLHVTVFSPCPLLPLWKFSIVPMMTVWITDKMGDESIFSPLFWWQ